MRGRCGDNLHELNHYKDKGLKGIFHCFSGNIEQANEIIDFGFYLGTTTDRQRRAVDFTSEYPERHGWIDSNENKVIINKEQEVIAYIIGMPSISEGLKKSNGKLFPFGFFHILRAMKKAKQLDLMLGAIKTEYQNILYWQP